MQALSIGMTVRLGEQELVLSDDRTKLLCKANQQVGFAGPIETVYLTAGDWMSVDGFLKMCAEMDEKEALMLNADIALNLEKRSRAAERVPTP
jgi:hypothetical protein